MPLQLATKKRSVTWSGAFCSNHSLALVNRELAYSLLDNKEFMKQFTLHVNQTEPPQFAWNSNACVARLAEHIGGSVTPEITIRHAWPPVFQRPVTGSLVMIQPWEFGELPKSWVEPVNQNCAEVWVPSTFVRETYLRAGVPADQVYVVPNGINPEIFSPDAAAIDIRADERFQEIKPGATVFLFVGGTISRKGADVLLKAWQQAFTADDNVSLVVKDFGSGSFYAGQGLGAQIKALSSARSTAPIVYIDTDLTAAEMTGLYRASSCLVHPYRGEGYGLPIAEAMACGRPTIVTNYGAALDFVNHTTSYLIPASVVRLAQSRIGDLETVAPPFWAEPDVDALTDLLRHVHNNRDEARDKGLNAAAHMAAHHTWRHAADIVTKRLESLRAPLSAAAVSLQNFALPFGLQGLSLTESFSELPSFDIRKRECIQAARGRVSQEIEDQLYQLHAEEPADSDISSALGVVLFKRHKPDLAVDALREGLVATPGSRDLHHNLAFVLLEIGRSQEALEHGLNALAVTPGDTDVRRMVERAMQAILQEARGMLKSVTHKRRASIRTSPVYTALMSLYRRADAAIKADGEVSRIRISLCMIAKNEERFLRNCLESVQGGIDEIVVVDTGSTDGTIAIAREFGAKVVTVPWTDDFAAARNASLAHATGNWALWLDADEELSPGSASELRRIIEETPQNIGAYMVRICNWLSHPYRHEGGERAFHHACRLFRNLPGVEFRGRVHEQNLQSIHNLGFGCVHEATLQIDHFGYAAEVMSLRNKHERFITMLHREVEECPEDWLKAFQLFNLANAYFTAGDMPNAEKYFREAASGINPDEEYTSLLYVEWATALHRLERSDEGLSVCREAEQKGLSHPGLGFAAGYCHLNLGDYAAARNSFAMSLAPDSSSRKYSDISGDAGLSSYKAMFGMALALKGLGLDSEALEMCMKAIDLQPEWTEPMYLAAVCFTDMGQLQPAADMLGKMLALNPGNEKAMERRAEILYQLERWEEALASLQQLRQIDPQNSGIMCKIAICNERLQRWQEALNAWSDVADVTGPTAEILVNVGRVLTALEAYGPAVDAYTEAIKLSPDYGNAYFNAGDLLYQLGYYPKAAETYLAGLQVEPERPSGFFVLGNCLFQSGQFDAAALAYCEELSHNPEHSQAQHNLELAREAQISQVA